MIVTMWKKNLEIKIGFESGNMMIKKCHTQDEFNKAWNTAIQTFKKLGHEIRLK